MADSKAKRARATAKIQVSKIGNFLANEASTASSSKLLVKLEILEKYYTAFHAAHAEIESIVKEDDIDGEMEACEQFDDLYCELKAGLLDLIEKTKPKPNDSGSNFTASSDQGYGQDRYYKLPTLNIPKFKGSYLEWTSFRDMFMSMVDSQTRMSNIDKLCFLKTLLEGEALDLIKTLKVTSANYLEAWNALNNRYSNKALIVKSHLSELFSLEKCNGTVASLKMVLDTTSANVCALENLGLESSSLSDAILYHIVTSKLDQRTKESYNEHRLSNPTDNNYSHLIQYLKSRVNSMADLPSGKDLIPSDNTKLRRNHAVKANQVLVNDSKLNANSNGSQPLPASAKTWLCIECNGNHPLFKCPQFTRKTVSERFKTVKNAKPALCFNCFRASHTSVKCTDTHSCRECGQKHHTLLHFPKNSDLTNDSTETSQPSSEPKVCTITQLTTNQVLLATAQLHMKDAYGQNQVVRAFLDPGAQANLITKRLANRLKLAVKSVPLTITVATNLQRKSNQIIECEISSRVTDFQAKIHAAVVPEICSKLPSQRVSTEKLPLTGKILADPDFDKPAEVDLLLCGEHYLDLFTEGHVPETAETPSMRNTVLGWIIGGKSTIATSSENAHELLINHCSISTALERFWAVEDTETSPNSSTIEEKACEKHFHENVTRLANGRFQVAIPLKADPSLLGESRDTAVRILKHTQWRLSANERVEYAAFMDEYQKLGHMVKIPNDNVDLTIPHAYIPHHPVIKIASKTTKVRAVFNGAKPTSSGVSVNDIQMKGPIRQKPLFCILIGFRFRKVGVCCDVEKMYRQVKVRKQDQNIQRIVWYDEEGNICDFWLTTVTYGFTSSSFLAIECLMYLAEEERHQFPLAAAALEEDFHVDDGITGAESATKARELIRQLNGLTAKGQFTLRKWASNDPSVLQGLATRNSNVEFLINSDEKVGTLGISWLPAQDKFVLAVTLSDTPDFNKRSILSEIAKIFDPLGLVTPVVITFKLFLRELWRQGCSDKAVAGMNP